MESSTRLRFRCVITLTAIGASLAGTNASSLSAGDVLPSEPVEIGTDPQFVFDNYVIDNHWALKYKRQAVRRVLHPPEKYKGNPVIVGDGGYVCVARDPQTGLFRMWYQTWVRSEIKGRSGRYAIAYAESEDGIDWKRPNLGLFEWQGSKENNIVWTGIRGRRGSSPFLLDIPERDRHGYRFIMAYREGDTHLIGSQDGIHWDRDSDTSISSVHSDTQNAIVYDPRRDEYVMYCRAKHIYRTFRGPILETGASRRVARMASDELWSEWTSEPQTILVPDEVDARENYNFFYGMPVRIYGGVYWGFLWCFRMNNNIHTELAFSRDGVRFERLPERPKFLARGPDGSWDDGMVFSGYQWIEMGDEWWMYYAGWDGPHKIRRDMPPRKPGIGLVKLRKEGFISMHGPSGGGVLATRKITWPGGPLLVNADAESGELKVRVTDANRKPLAGFDYDDCETFTGDEVAHRVRWKDQAIGQRAGGVIRLEFFLKDADLYTFRAGG